MEVKLTSIHLILSVALRRLIICVLISTDKESQCLPVGVSIWTSCSFVMNSDRPSMGVHTGVVIVLDRDLLIFDSEGSARKRGF